jgi:hypothetical protein
VLLNDVDTSSTSHLSFIFSKEKAGDAAHKKAMHKNIHIFMAMISLPPFLIQFCICRDSNWERNL